MVGGSAGGKMIKAKNRNKPQNKKKQLFNLLLIQSDVAVSLANYLSNLQINWLNCRKIVDQLRNTNMTKSHCYV